MLSEMVDHSIPVSILESALNRFKPTEGQYLVFLVNGVIEFPGCFDYHLIGNAFYNFAMVFVKDREELNLLKVVIEPKYIRYIADPTKQIIHNMYRLMEMRGH